MGLRGPKPKPAALKLLGNNPGKRPLLSQRGRVRKGIPDRPPEVTDEAAAEWDRIAAELDASGLLSVVDRGILAAYCTAVADMLAARNAIVEDGRFVITPIQTSGGVKLGDRKEEHPAVKMIERARAQVLKLAESLGLTPASRARLNVEAEPEPTSEPTGNAVLDIRARILAARESTGAS